MIVSPTSGPALEQAVIFGMVPHHQAAIDMAGSNCARAATLQYGSPDRDHRVAVPDITEMTRVARSRY